MPFLGGPLLEANLKPDFALGPYNQIFQTCLDPQGAFGKKCDVIVLLFRFEDIIYDDLVLACQGDATAYQRCREKVDLLASALTNLAGAFTGSIIIDVPPFPTLMPSHERSLETPMGLGHLHRVLTTAFLEQAGRIKSVRLFDLDALQRETGAAKSFDTRPWYLYHQPYPDSFLEAIGSQLCRIVLAQRRAPKKCILLDCDNTLWGRHRRRGRRGRHSCRRGFSRHAVSRPAAAAALLGGSAAFSWRSRARTTRPMCGRFSTSTPACC